MEIFSALLSLCEGISPVTGEIPSQRPVTQSFDVFFDLRLNKRLSKQSRHRWFDTTSRSLWRQWNVTILQLSIWFWNGCAGNKKNSPQPPALFTTGVLFIIWTISWTPMLPLFNAYAYCHKRQLLVRVDDRMCPMKTIDVAVVLISVSGVIVVDCLRALWQVITPCDLVWHRRERNWWLVKN